jgi:hypothetical protein
MDAICQEAVRRSGNNITAVAIPLSRAAVHGAEVVRAGAKDAGRGTLCVDVCGGTAHVGCQVAAGVSGDGVVLENL